MCLATSSPAHSSTPPTQARAQSKASAGKLFNSKNNGSGVLDAKLFRGNVRLGYQYAKNDPQLTKELFCYCGCDVTESHKTLLDCYTDKNKHAADCKECVDELLQATKMKKEGQSLLEIQKTLHGKFGQYYPFSEATPAYTQYLQRARLKFMKSSLAEPLPGSPDSADPPPLTPDKSAQKKPGCCDNESTGKNHK
jgi:hypothetical protein